MTTRDGCRITTIEQDGAYAGEDLGRLWMQNDRGDWAWYGGFLDDARRQECLAQAQRMTWREFDQWFDEAPKP